MKATTVIVGSDSFPCLQFFPGLKSTSPDDPPTSFISICVLWELLLNVYGWVYRSCPSIAFLIQIVGERKTSRLSTSTPATITHNVIYSLSPIDNVCRQLLQLVHRLYGADVKNHQLRHVGNVHRKTINELKLVIIDQDNPFDIWLTGLDYKDPRVPVLNEK